MPAVGSWYMDDGQASLEPSAVDAFLHILDEQLGLVGATRGEGADVESLVKLVGRRRSQ